MPKEKPKIDNTEEKKKAIADIWAEFEEDEIVE
jgi:hypothetical protein